MKKSQRGFTLIEMMLVLGIIAALLIATGKRIYKGADTPNTIIRKFGVLTRQLHTQAKLQGVTFRLVLARDAAEEGKEAHAFWVERSSQAGPVLIAPQDPEEPKEEPEEDEDGAKPPAPFAMDTRMLKEPLVMPSNLQFKQVETDGYTEPVESGRAYIHFFPQGLVEEAVIQLTNQKGLEWSLLIHPLTGKTDLIKSHVELRDLRDD